MNILFANTAGHFGGNERWASMAIAELEQRGHKVWMACPDLPHAARFTRHERLFHGGPSSLWDGAGRARLREFCRDKAIDVVLPTSQKLFFTYGRMARRMGIGIVVRLGIIRLPWRPVVDWFGYGVYPHAIVVNSKRVKRLLSWAPFVKPDRIEVIYNGIVAPPSVKLERHPEAFTITSVGTVSRRKGMGHLLRALARLPRDELDGMRLQIIGAGPALPRYRKLAVKLGLADNVEFTGNVDSPAAYVAASDLFVLLSSQEGISNALLEAMSVGVPVYTTLVGGHGEFIQDGNNAFAARSRRPIRVARDLQRIMAHPALADVAKAGQETALTHFSLSEMGNQLDQLLTQVAGRAGEGR